MSDTEPRVGERRPGGRAARVRTAVLDATSALLAEVGYDFTVEEVAARAGVHKTTVYRRWPTKPDLVIDAVQVQSAADVPVPDTGRLVDDLRALAREVVANIASEGGTRRSRSIVAASASSDDMATGMHAFWSHRLGLTAAVVDHAIERGEIAADTDPNLVIETLVGPLWFRLLLTGEPVDDAFADRVAELVAAGVGAPH